MRYVLALAAAVSLATQAALAQHAEVSSWKVDGLERRAIVFAPGAPSEGGGAPLVLSFHGHGDFMQNFQRTDMQNAWPEAIVVYFQGLSTRDGLSGWQVEKGQDGDRDLKLVDAALAALRQRFKVDENRVYATGFSNGAMFTYLLWAERPSVFAAYAPVAARLRSSVRLKVPKPVFHVAGTHDQTIPFEAQQEAIETAMLVNKVSGTGTSCGRGCTLYNPGDDTATVMTWIHSGGHEYPPSTSERIATFFRGHHLTH